MKFFKPEDFVSEVGQSGDLCTAIGWLPTDINRIVEDANEKLKREGKVVYGVTKNDKHDEATGFIPRWAAADNFFSGGVETDSKALLIAIEPNIKCIHAKEDVTYYKSHGLISDLGFICKCGTRVEATQFKEIK